MTFAEDSELVWRQLASMKLKQPKERELEIGKKKTQCSGVLIFEVRETNGYTQASIRENFTYLKRKSVNSQLKAQPNKILQSASVIRTSLGSLTTVGNTGFTGHCQNNPWQREKKQSKIAETRDYSELMRTLRIWTRDLQIFSLTLSQLSYLGIW